MRKFSLITLIVLSSASLSAFISSCPGRLAVEAEFLFLLPSVDDTYFVIEAPSSSSGPIGKRRNNDFSFSPGFRIEGDYAFCDCNQEFRASYTRLRSCATEEFSGDFLSATVGSALLVGEFENYAGTASSSNDILYQRVDGLFSQQIWQCCRSDLCLYGGFEYAYIRMSEEINYQRRVGAPTFGEVDQISRAWGIGPQFGVEFDYHICSFSWCCVPGNLSITGQTSGSLLASKTQIKSFNQIFPFLTPNAPLDVKDEPTWRIIPVWHARFGLNYATCLSCYDVSLEVGYEFNTYVRAVNWQAFPHTVSTDSTIVTTEGSSLCYTAYKNFDAHGLYAKLGASF